MRGRQLLARQLKRSLRPLFRHAVTPIRARRNARKSTRRLEIGPGQRRIPGFETLNVFPGRGVDYVCDARARLPFAANSFDLIYASHILEHVPWYETPRVLREWVRILKPGGALEIWVPDGLKIARAYVQAEDAGVQDYMRDGWWRYNDERDPCVWMAGRCFSYGDGTGRQNDPNWHRALFSERYLAELLRDAGLVGVRRMRAEEVRGYDHGWINLGVRGQKPAEGQDRPAQREAESGLPEEPAAVSRQRERRRA